MPYRKSYARKPRNYGRKRRGATKARRGGRKRTVLVNKSPSLIPDRYFCKLNYSEQFGITTSTSYNNRIYQTSLYDPRYSSGGHQPLGFDQMATLYDKYIVYGMKYVITVNNESAASANIAAIFKNVTTVTTGIETIIERPYSTVRVLGPDSGSRNTATFSKYMSVNKIYGVPKKMINMDDKFNASTSSTPSQPCYLHLFQSTVDGVSSVTVCYTVKIIYYACFYDRIPLATST